MALTEKQQVIEALKKTERPLIAFRKRWNPDGVASAVGLFALLQALGKQPEIVCEDFSRAERLSFLPHIDRVRPELSSLRKFVISIDTSKSRIGELSYEAKDGFLHIYLTPKTGNLEASHVQTSATDYRHDLVITVDTPDLASLGSMRETAADFLYKTPILNIDHSPANEQYGQINYVDSTAASVGEIIHIIAKDLNHPLSPELATALLTGIVSKTRSFKEGAFTPRTLTSASELVAAGAKRDIIVQSLYRTKTIPMLKLWGRTLARMKFDSTHKIASSVLTRQDFVLAGAEEADLAEVIDELIGSAPDAETIALIFERNDGGVCCVVRSDIRKDADRLTAPWDGEGGRTESRCFLKGKSVVEVERDVLAHARATIAG
jgi:phosphoesterase RecJ-like protein